jgi:hypothetical protein
MAGIESYRYVAHARGLSSLMVANGSVWSGDPIGQSIFHSSYFDEVSYVYHIEYKQILTLPIIGSRAYSGRKQLAI